MSGQSWRAGWYPDLSTGGTMYWDGSRWTGDTRPPRKRFAAASSPGVSALVLMVGGLMTVYGIIALSDPAKLAREDESISTVGAVVLGLVFTFVVGPATLVAAFYFLRGRGPTDLDVKKRLAKKREEDDAAAKEAAKLSRRGRPFFGVNVEAPDVVGVAQVNAVANPETARALQNLQNLLYTQALTEAQYEAAKERLLGAQPATSDSFSQLAKIVELHQAGVLSDVEFAAAKAKALGLY